MLKKTFSLFILLLPLLHFAQDFSALWEGHFSYFNIKDVIPGNNKIYAAAENAIFSYDTDTNDIEKLTTVNGLSGESISTIYYSTTYELLIIGYENGLIEIAFDNDDKILTVVDIIDKPTIPSIDKRINHFNSYNNVIYISTNFGISVFDLERLEFGDTYFIGNSGAQLQVKQTAIKGDYIYAACSNGNGIKKAQISNPNLIDFRNWQTITTGSFLSVEYVENALYAVNTGRRIFEIVNDVPVTRFTYNDAPLHTNSVNNRLTVTTKNDVFVYDAAFNLIVQATVSTDFPTVFTSATSDSEFLYIGTKNFGVLKTAIANPVNYGEIHPDGPLLNTPFSIQAGTNKVWVSFGDYTSRYVPSPVRPYGLSKLDDELWRNIPYDSLFNLRNLNNIAINPFNPQQVFVSSFQDGLLEILDDIPTNRFDQTNSGLESYALPTDPNAIGLRLSGSVFDRDGLLWSMTAIIDKPLKSYNPNTDQWQSYDFSSLIPDPFGNLGFSDLVIDNNSTKWIGSYNYGLIVYNENSGTPLLKNIREKEENMPTTRTWAVALDKRNQLWIGTESGLRVLYNTSDFFTNDNATVEEIIILEDGIAKELLFQQFVTDIKVDGSNNKWIATADSGLFYFSSDGQQTIYHFTTDNSPLPSNTVNDVAIDDVNGIVYIATSKGLVSFRSGSSDPLEDLTNTFAYPNPVRPNFNIVDEKVKIKDLSENVNIKITDIEGNLVAEAQSRTNQRYNGFNLEIDGGTAYWNGKNLANNIVASGVYLVMLSDLDTFETRIIKLMVVR
ncbi:type IX secretion system anionic LPS delivery protein PorZ [Changchengzhania lutea]|uniref:type IX secretion system anionic LPS delivery protein PorZ n=1 Tax=Changchengzhania lutea TaxID=2049305 RepID=UPI00115DE55A|nr:ABC transporter substrate-binding protein [Changchengzhania lutea]